VRGEQRRPSADRHIEGDSPRSARGEQQGECRKPRADAACGPGSEGEGGKELNTRLAAATPAAKKY